MSGNVSEARMATCLNHAFDCSDADATKGASQQRHMLQEGRGTCSEHNPRIMQGLGYIIRLHVSINITCTTPNHKHTPNT